MKPTSTAEKRIATGSARIVVLLLALLFVGCAGQAAHSLGLFLHSDATTGGDCAQCHDNLVKTQRPAGHNARFLAKHKRYAYDPTCAFCHGPDQCTTCHRTRKPASHNAGWKPHFHGKQAARDKRACVTCHDPAYCQRCHAARPLSHGDGFLNTHGGEGRRNPRRCLTCHDPVRDGCLNCHDPNVFRYR